MESDFVDSYWIQLVQLELSTLQDTAPAPLQTVDGATRRPKAVDLS